MIDVLVYEPNGTTLICYVADVISVSVMEELDDQGGGSLTIAYDNPTLTANPTLLDLRNVVKVRVDGTVRGAFLIKKRQETVVGGDEAARQISVSGPGLLSWLDDAIIYSELPTPYSGLVRWFNWGSKTGSWYDASKWGVPAQVRERGGIDLIDPTNPWQGAPIAWPDTDTVKTFWIWDRPTADSTAPAGDCYFRRSFAAATAGTYRLYLAVDNVAHVMIDGEPVALVRHPYSWRRTWEVQVELSAGPHIIGVKVRNYSASPAGFLMAGFRDEDGVLSVVSALCTSSSGWRINSYPGKEPGWTPTQIISTLLSEADDRSVGVVPFITDGLNATTDEQGYTWEAYPISINVGETIWDMCQTLRDLDFYPVIDPDTQELVAYKNRGQAQDAVVDASAHIVDESDTTEDYLVNAMLVLTEGQWVGTKDIDSIATYGRIERFLNLSSVSGDAAQKIIAGNIIINNTPKEAVEVVYEPVDGNRPWVDFNVGDTINVTTASGAYTRREVMSISVAIDEAGRESYTVELDSIYRRELERVRSWIDRASAGDGKYAEVRQLEENPVSDPVGGDNPVDGGLLPDDDIFSNDDFIGGPGFSDAWPVYETPNTDLWTPPDDPSGGSGEAFDVGLVRATAASSMTDYYVDNGDYEIALLTSEPTLTSGEWDSDLSGIEQTGTGYARVAVTTAGLSAATGTTPVVRTNTASIAFPSNSGESDWDAITHVAIIQTGLSDAILSVIPLSTPLVVSQNEAVGIPVGNLQFTVGSA